ncbi:expressed unknown protein [Seminavis robusta]|uniref:Uncharacterized protein n=1 Tax=Seminavis robusta TaxID=568900 RepID=A0A9N8DGV4_9STRA|nr:expressed unknown protein [Seminavis robusta]|eukprot:Sro80_g043290.1 n/a (206) ;mRNA; r:123533-124372
MPPFGAEPDWATPGDTSTPAPAPAPPVAAGAAPVAANGGDESGGGQIRCMIVMLSVLCLALAGSMGTLGVLTLLETKATSLEDIAATPFLASYMIMFALLLFLYEMMWWMPVPAVNKTLRKNFGFMYGLKGKGFYLIFVAFLCLGLMGEQSQTVEYLGWATGIAFLAVGILHIFLILSNPDFIDYYKPPTAGLERLGATEGDNVV